MRRPVLLALVCVFAASACDREVGPGETLLLAMRELVLGFEKPNAVSVLAGGSVIVQDADVLGRGLSISPDSPIPPFPSTGAGIVSSGGHVRVVAGLVAGGNAAILVDAPESAGSGKGFLGPGLVADRQSTVEILGGTVRSGGLFVAEDVIAPGVALFSPDSALTVSDSVLRISGGTIAQGDAPFAASGRSVAALRSSVEISGGSFPSGVGLTGSRSRIRGGDFASLGLVADVISHSFPFQFSPGCTEIRGGSFGTVSIALPGERLIVFGTGFNRPLGPIPAPFAGSTNPNAIFAPPAVFALSGTLESGAPFAFELQVRAGTQVSLAAPGSPGCE